MSPAASSSRSPASSRNLRPLRSTPSSATSFRRNKFHITAKELKSILHNWSDEDCVKILKRCKEAVPPKEEGGKVIILDMVINSHNPKITETHLFYDICMMIGLGGMERKEHEWRKIFNNAGFSDYKIFPILGVYSVIALYPLLCDSLQNL